MVTIPQTSHHTTSTPHSPEHEHDLLQSADRILANLDKIEKDINQSAKEEAKKEKQTEKEKAEKKYFQVDDTKPDESPYVVKSAQVSNLPQTTAKSANLIKIEKIMEDGLADLYQSLDDGKKVEFQHLGEETASAIDVMIRSFKVAARKVIDLIKHWLSIIPGIDRIFLEQEAKIKTQKIMAYARQYRKENRKQQW